MFTDETEMFQNVTEYYVWMFTFKWMKCYRKMFDTRIGWNGMDWNGIEQDSSVRRDLQKSTS